MKSKITNKILAMVVILVATLGIMPLPTNGAETNETNNAPTITFEQMGGEVVKQSADFITDKNPNGYAKVKVTAKDPDGDGITYIFYNWDYDLNGEAPYYFEYQEMKASHTVGIKVPQENGLHILRVCAVDQKKNKSDWIAMPYYIVDEKSEKVDNTLPVLNQQNPEELPRNDENINLGRDIKVRFSDKESGIYYIAYNWQSDLSESEPDLSEYIKIRQPKDDMITIKAPTEIGKWYLRVYATNSVYNTEKEMFTTSDIYRFDYTVEDLEAPIATLNGEKVVEISENGTYVDEGAKVVDNYDEEKVIYANNDNLDVIAENTYRFGKRGEYTLTYKTKDSRNNESNEVTRTVKVLGESEIVKVILPDKNDYKYGEAIDLTGASIEVTSKSGEVSNVPVTESMFTNFDTNRLGAYTATLNYDGKAYIYPYEVRDYLKEVRLVKPSKTNYNYKEALDLTGGSVQKIMASGIEMIAEPITEAMLINQEGKDYTFNSEILGEQNIQIRYAGEQASFNIKVDDLSAPEITLNNGIEEDGINKLELELPVAGLDLNDYTVTDNYDSENGIEINVVITSNNVNAEKAGEYTVIYEAVDSHGNKAVKTRKVIITIDKSILDGLLDQVKDLDKNDYTDDSWNELENSVKLPDDTLKDLDDKKTGIENAISGLVKKQLDTTEFDNVREEIRKLVETDYTVESWKNLKNKIKAGYEAKDTGLQSKLNSAVEELKQAVKDLVAINPLDMTKLEDIEKDLNDNYNKNDYTAKSWKELQDVIAAAKQITDLQSKFDKTVSSINIDNTLVAKSVNTAALDAIKAELAKLNKDEYTENSWNEVQNKIQEAESKTLQSKFDEKVEAIDLNTLVLKPVVNDVKVTTSNKNEKYAKPGDVVTISFKSNVELDLSKTTITLNAVTSKASKVEGKDNEYTASFTMTDKYKEGNVRYTINAFETREAVNVEVKNDKAGVIFDKTAPVVEFAEGIGDKALEVKNPYEVKNQDVVVSDNLTKQEELKIEVTTDLDVNVVKDSYTATYKVTDLAGNEALKTRTIKVQDTTKPVIKLNGEKVVVLELNQEQAYVDAGAIATDNYDNSDELTNKIVVVNSVNIANASEYIVTYNVIDSNGNAAEEVTRTVRVLDKTQLHEMEARVRSLIQSNYTDVSWRALQNSLKLPETTQTEVNNKVQAIVDALNNLDRKALDTKKFDDVSKEIAKLVPSDYTEQTWKAVLDKQAEIQDEISNNVRLLQSELDQKVKDLEELITKLEAKQVNQEAIKTIERHLNNKYNKNDYTAKSWKELQDVIAAAKQITDLQSKFDKTVSGINIDNTLVAKSVNTAALDAIKAELAKLNKNDYTENSWNEVQNKIQEAESKTLQSKFDEKAKQINLTTLVLIPKIEKIETISNNSINKNYAKPGDIVTITFTSNIELDLEKTIIKLNNTEARVQKIDENKYTASFIMTDKFNNGNLKYTITAFETRESASVEKKDNTNVIFDKTAPTISFADNITDVTVKYGSDYVPSKNDVIVTDANLDKVDIVTTYENNKLGKHIVSYKAVDKAGNESNTITRNITVKDYAIGITITEPEKLVYKQNEVFEYAGGRVQLVMKSGNAGAEVAMSDNEVSVTGFNSVNPGRETITVEYKGFKALFEITILDSIKPNIILNKDELGNKDINVEVGSSYMELGATATDENDGDLTANIVITGEVDTTKLGIYTVTYTVQDSAENEDVATRTVTVVDTTKPVITLEGKAKLTIEAGSKYVEPGAKATDNYDGDISNKIKVNASDLTENINKPGTYVIKYVVRDSSENQSTVATREVEVVDTTAPTITLNGEADITIEVKDTYTDEGVTVTDIVDTNLTPVITGTVDTQVVGDYTITYSAIDTAGNSATPVTRTVHVVDTTKPVISLNGNSDVTVEVNSTYTDDGVILIDNYDADIQSKLVVENTVDTAKLGDYTVKYNVADSNNNVADEVTRTVHVVDTTKPTITLKEGQTSITMIAGDDFVEPEFEISDNYDTECKIVRAGEFNSNKEGEYTLVYKAKDSSGNESDGITINVKVQAVPPVISFVLDGKDTPLENGTVFRKDTEISFDKGTATLTRKNGDNEEVINDFKGGTLADGEYTITATDRSGSTTTVNFVVDSTAPVVNLRSGFYDGEVNIKFEDPDDVFSAILTSSEGTTDIKDGYTDSGVTINKKGVYSLIVLDSNRNFTKVDFEIR